MGQVAFDTQEFVETLENAGLPKDQARAISIAVRKSHEVADVATKRDLEDVGKEIDARFDKVDARFEKHEAQMQARFEKTDAQIADVRKDMAAQFEKTDAKINDVRKDMAAQFEKTDAKINDVRKDMEHRFDKTDAHMEALTDKLLIKVTKVIIGCVGLASTIVTLIIKFL